MDYTTIQQQIIRKSDEDLMAEIKSLTDPIYGRITDKWYESVRYVETVQGKTINIEIPHQGMLVGVITKALFDTLYAKRRKKALDSFISKVDRLRNNTKSLVFGMNYNSKLENR